MLGKTQAVFDLVWQVMAEHGEVDAIFGAEYQRIRRLWIWSDNYGPDLVNWIRAQANKPPEKKKP